MFNNVKIKIIVILLIIVSSIYVIPFQLKSYAEENIDNSNIVSLYCWEIDDFNLSKLKDEVEYLKINTLYIQKPSNISQKDRLYQIMDFAKQYKLDVFLLDGARDWLTTGDIRNVTDLIDMAYEMNQTLLNFI